MPYNYEDARTVILLVDYCRYIKALTTPYLGAITVGGEVIRGSTVLQKSREVLDSLQWGHCCQQRSQSA